jgi:hypothetical protein
MLEREREREESANGCVGIRARKMGREAKREGER